MAKEKDEVTSGVTAPANQSVENQPTENRPPATTRPGFSTEVTDAPDSRDPNDATPSQRVQEEQAAGRAAIRDGGRGSAARPPNPADADPARAAEVAQEMNAENEARDREEAHPVPEGEIPPGEVPSRGIPAGGILEGDELKQGTPDHRTQDPRLSDPDSPEAKQAEAMQQSREAQEAQAKERDAAEEKKAQEAANRPPPKKK